ncbi:FAST kinase domain-containing protein 5, mitochondrial [Trachemys scripta elegans]|uniref:FAST kinase domain-containing protein 5, mitochondrial n=1 Tax=Trachemys scripta elegans TaxID=31138 RepID=UPI0015568F68|nr:FAST kinase domain-containing protein 5, mitochondrial [Trachemys scripta elegans]
MATMITCRRFPGGVRSMVAFSTITKCGTMMRIPSRKQKEDESPEVSDTDAKAAASIGLLNLLEYRVLYNPSAYTRTKTASHQNAARNCEDSEGPLGNEFSSLSAKQFQNTYSVTCSQSRSSTKHTLLDLEFHKTLSTQASSVPPATLEPQEDKLLDADVKTHDSKEDPRMFQKHRPEYRSLSYDKSETLQVLPLEEGDLILHKVSVLQSSLIPGTIVEYICRLSCLPVEEHVMVISNIKFKMLCRYGVENIQLFNISELTDILKAFIRLGIQPTDSMLRVYETEICHRVWDMSLDQVLLVADLLRCLGCSVPHYLQISFSYINLHWQDLTLPQLVQLIYIIGEGRRVPQDLMQKLETLVLKYLNSFNLEEVGAISLGFFKSKSAFSEYVMRKIGDKVSGHLADMSSYAIVNVLKMFRYTRVIHLEFLKQLGKVVPPRIGTMGIQGVMHITLACSALHYLDEGIMNAAAFSVSSRVMYCRSKDVAKFLWSFGCLNYEPPNAERFYSSLREQMYRKLYEFDKFPEHFLTCLLALAFAGQFPDDLIDYALSAEFIQLTRENKFDLKKDLFTLDGSVEIECPDYKGNRLTPQFRQEVTEMLWNSVKKEICGKPEVTEALSVLEVMLGGPQYVKNHMILPHARSNDIEVHLGKDRKPLPFNLEAAAAAKGELQDIGVSLKYNLKNQLLKEKSSGKSLVGSKTQTETCSQKEAVDQKQAPPIRNHSPFSYGIPLTDTIFNALTKPKHSPENRLSQLRPQPRDVKLAIQVSNKNHYCYDSKHLLGMHSLKRRQLQKLGYVVVEVPFWEWVPLLRQTQVEKLNYLHHKVFNLVL